MITVTDEGVLESSWSYFEATLERTSSASVLTGVPSSLSSGGVVCGSSAAQRRPVTDRIANAVARVRFVISAECRGNARKIQTPLYFFAAQGRLMNDEAL